MLRIQILKCFPKIPINNAIFELYSTNGAGCSKGRKLDSLDKSLPTYYRNTMPRVIIRKQ